MAISNRRVFYAVYSCAIAAPLGSTTYSAVHGLQSVGLSTKFNLQQYFEVSQISLYANLEDIPDIEVTLSKNLDGYPLLYHIATTGALDPSLVGRSNQRCSLGLSIYTDTQQSASGVPLSQCVCSGLYVSSISYTINVNGAMTEDLTLVGNNKTWSTVFTAPTFNNADQPYGSGIQRRQDVVMGLCVFPSDIPGIVSGVNPVQADGSYAAHIQSVMTSTNLGRTPLYELGWKGAYFRYAEFPVQVTTDIDVIPSQGDSVQALELNNNLVNQTIQVVTHTGTKIWLGNSNKLQGSTWGGANAGTGGGNATMTYSYLTFNDFTVTDPQDPSGL